MSIVFKSGTNQLHGSVEDRFIGKSMIHRSYLEQLPRTNPFTYHETTLLFSGPVNIPKVLQQAATRLSGSLDSNITMRKPVRASAQTTFLPKRCTDGDFSFGGQTTPRPLPIYNPYSSRLEGTTWVRDPFPGQHDSARTYSTRRSRNSSA